MFLANDETYLWTVHWLVVVDWTLRLGVSFRVIMRQRPVEATLAWLAIVLVAPFVGAFAYALLGETTLGRTWARRAADLRDPLEAFLARQAEAADTSWLERQRVYPMLHAQALAMTGKPGQAGNHIRLLSASDYFFESLIEDIRASSRFCHMEFYIWNPGGNADRVSEALIDAASRGVDCRVLVDDLGSRAFLRSSLARRMREAGVHIVGALPVNPIRLLFVRMDLRNHRKIVVIDGDIAYTGSQNLADPMSFGAAKGSDIGPWVDATMRLTGPCVDMLESVFLVDWHLNTGALTEAEAVEFVRDETTPQTGGCVVQVLPSGPGTRRETIHQMLLTMLYNAQEEIVLTTPYFVPDPSLLAALKTAAARGVAVHVVVPRKPDSRLVRWTSRSVFRQLTEAGVHLHLFAGGLLHTKSITMDHVLTAFGSVNLDHRSFWLNFETTLLIYDERVSDTVRKLQQDYIARSESPTSDMLTGTWATRFKDNLARLASPLL